MERQIVEIISELRKELVENADEKTRISGERFFKEDVKLYGIKSDVVSLISKKHFKALPEKDKAFVFGICEELWRTGIMEESFVACNWAFNVRNEFVRSDFGVFERWIKNYVGNWASCDTLCNHTVGSAIEMYPSEVERLRKWALDPGRWMKRAAAVSLIIPARKGLFLADVFQIADILLQDKDDMVQKGYGWMLKAASQAEQKKVFDFVMERKDIMPRTSLRYAIEKMPPELKAAAMAK
jgi:3-methyladenine DNA glycosylase AlkD